MTLISSCESARVEALYRYQILDSGSDSTFDELTHLAAYLCRTPIAAISFVDAERQWFKSSVGLDHKEAMREGDFCAYTIAGTDCFIVGNADADKRFKNHPWVVEPPALRFYAGVPLLSPDGYAIGILAVMDLVPRTLSPEQRICLRSIANQVMAQLELRSHARGDNLLHTSNGPLFNQAGRGAHLLALCEDITEQRKAKEFIRENERTFCFIFERAPVGIATIDSLTGRFLSVNTSLCAIVGYANEEMLSRTFFDITHPDDLQARRDQMTRLLDGKIATLDMDSRVLGKMAM